MITGEEELAAAAGGLTGLTAVSTKASTPVTMTVRLAKLLSMVFAITKAAVKSATVIDCAWARAVADRAMGIVDVKMTLAERREAEDDTSHSG